MKRRIPFPGLLALLALVLFASPIHAQTSAAAATPAARPGAYDISKEVTLTGTVTRVLKETTPEMKTLGGAHLILETSSGALDANVGGYALRGKGALSVTAGEQVEVTGVMKTIRGKQVFVTRRVQAGGRTFVIRNEHGFLLTPASRNANLKSEAKGGQL
jgi:DNA/RNA endonuclease YhcR with UshA esterase domain